MKVMQPELERITTWLENYKEKTNCKGVVLGLSGGKDSTVVAMLAKKVWGDNVVALLMPNGEQKDLHDALHIATTLGLRYKVVNIEMIYNNLLLNIENQLVVDERGEREWIENCPKVTDKAKTNIPPRLRMTILYAVAQTLGYRVIGTGNASEAYIGWTTKWGDSAYDFNPIAHLTCTEVMELGKVLAEEFGIEERFVTKTPADGLCGKSDEESFGFSYRDLDYYLRSGILPPQAASATAMHKASAHKRRLPYTVLDEID